MSYVAGVLNMYMDPPSAFAVFRYLVEENGLEDYYCTSMCGLLEDSKIFQKIFEIHLPQMAVHLKKNSVDVILFVTPWFLSLFTGITRWSAVLLFFDMLFVEGKQALFRFALAILTQLEKLVLSVKDLHHILPILQRPPPELLDPKELGEIARSIEIESIILRGIQQHKREELQVSTTNLGITKKEEEQEPEEGSFWDKVWKTVATPRRPCSPVKPSTSEVKRTSSYPFPNTSTVQRVTKHTTSQSFQFRPLSLISSPNSGTAPKNATASPAFNRFLASSILPDGNDSPNAYQALKEFATPRNIL
jgi:hypothetical protein